MQLPVTFVIMRRRGLWAISSTELTYLFHATAAKQGLEDWSDVAVLRQSLVVTSMAGHTWATDASMDIVGGK